MHIQSQNIRVIFLINTIACLCHGAVIDDVKELKTIISNSDKPEVKTKYGILRKSITENELKKPNIKSKGDPILNGLQMQVKNQTGSSKDSQEFDRFNQDYLVLGSSLIAPNDTDVPRKKAHDITNGNATTDNVLIHSRSVHNNEYPNEMFNNVVRNNYNNNNNRGPENNYNKGPEKAQLKVQSQNVRSEPKTPKPINENFEPSRETPIINIANLTTSISDNVWSLLTILLDHSTSYDGVTITGTSNVIKLPKSKNSVQNLPFASRKRFNYKYKMTRRNHNLKTPHENIPVMTEEPHQKSYSIKNQNQMAVNIPKASTENPDTLNRFADILQGSTRNDELEYMYPTYYQPNPDIHDWSSIHNQQQLVNHLQAQKPLNDVKQKGLVDAEIIKYLSKTKNLLKNVYTHQENEDFINRLQRLNNHGNHYPVSYQDSSLVNPQYEDKYDPRIVLAGRAKVGDELDVKTSKQDPLKVKVSKDITDNQDKTVKVPLKDDTVEDNQELWSTDDLEYYLSELKNAKKISKDTNEDKGKHINKKNLYLANENDSLEPRTQNLDEKEILDQQLHDMIALEHLREVYDELSSQLKNQKTNDLTNTMLHNHGEENYI